MNVEVIFDGVVVVEDVVDDVADMEDPFNIDEVGPPMDVF